MDSGGVGRRRRLRQSSSSVVNHGLLVFGVVGCWRLNFPAKMWSVKKLELEVGSWKLAV